MLLYTLSISQSKRLCFFTLTKHYFPIISGLLFAIETNREITFQCLFSIAQVCSNPRLIAILSFVVILIYNGIYRKSTIILLDEYPKYFKSFDECESKPRNKFSYLSVLILYKTIINHPSLEKSISFITDCAVYFTFSFAEHFSLTFAITLLSRNKYLWNKSAPNKRYRTYFRKLAARACAVI